MPQLKSNLLVKLYKFKIFKSESRFFLRLFFMISMRTRKNRRIERNGR